MLALSSQVFVLYVHTTRLIKIYIRKVSEMFIFCNSNKHEIMHFNKLTKLSPKFFFHLEKKQVHLHFSFFLSFNLFCLLMVCKQETNATCNWRICQSASHTKEDSVLNKSWILASSELNMFLVFLNIGWASRLKFKRSLIKVQIKETIWLPPNYSLWSKY